MGLMSIRLGTNDTVKARAFYDATFAALGFPPCPLPPEAPFIIFKLPEGPAFMVGPTANGEPATYANGGTIGFSAPDAAAVDAWHAAGLAHGGGCEGAPGPRERAGGKYGAYLRDPDGNKLCAYAGLTIGG